MDENIQKPRIAIYCHFSKDNKHFLVDYCKKQNWNISNIYSDDNYNSFDNQNLGWSQMIRDAKKDLFDIILYETQALFAKESKKFNSFLQELFSLSNIHFITVINDTPPKKTVTKRNVANDEFSGALAPYGYKKDENNKHHLIIDKENAKIVQYIFQMITEGNNICGICNQLTHEQILTPSKTTKGIWAPSTVNRILHNQIYLGKAKYIHEPIIQKETFDKVQSLLHNRIKTQIKDQSGPHLLAGKVRCKNCGSPMHKSNSCNKLNINYVYLRCSLAYRTKNKKCTPHRIRYETVVSYLETEIQKRLTQFSQEKIKWEAFKNAENLRADQHNELLQNKITNLNKNFVTLYLDRVKGILTEEEFWEVKSDIGNKLYHLKNAALEISKKYAEDKDFQLTRSTLYYFIDFIEVEEKNGEHTNFIIHWN
jgi:site-specific DNA recombinase